MGDYQEGFRKDKSVVDQIHLICCTKEVFMENRTKIDKVFIVFKKEYDMIERGKL